MPLKNKIVIRGRDLSDSNNPNEYDNNFKDDINNDITRFRFAKQPKVLTQIHENTVLKRSISNRASTATRNKTDAFSTNN